VNVKYKHSCSNTARIFPPRGSLMTSVSIYSGTATLLSILGQSSNTEPINISQRKLEGKYSLESTDPRKSEIRAHLRP